MKYDYQCKNQIIIVAMLPGEKPLAITFDKENLRDTALSHVPKQEEETMDPTIDDKDYGNPFQNIIAEVISGQYSLKELKSMLQNLKMNDEGLQDVIEAIELQIEASEKGESSIELPKDPEEEPEEEKQEEPQKKPQEELSEEEAIIQLEEFKKQRRKQNLHREIDIDDLYQKVIRTLIAQDVPARRVIAELARKEMNSKKKKRGILLTGTTGVGKTELMRLIAKYLKGCPSKGIFFVSP